MRVAAQALANICEQAASRAMTPAQRAEGGEVAVALSTLTAAICAILRTSQAMQSPNFELTALAIGAGFGDLLRHSPTLDLGPITAALGAGMNHALFLGQPAPVGMKQ